MITFNGVDQAINLTAITDPINCLNDVAAATMMGWFRFDDQSNGNLMAFSIGNGGVNTNTVRMELDRTGGGTNCTRAQAPDGAGLILTTDPAGPLATNTEFHLAAANSISGDNESLYRNGALSISAAAAFAPAVFSATGSDSAAIMANPDASSTGAVNGASDGDANDCRIYQRQLSANEIATIHACRGHDGIWSGIHHRWTLSENAPGVSSAGAGFIRDTSANNISASSVGAPTYGESRLSLRRRYL